LVVPGRSTKGRLRLITRGIRIGVLGTGSLVVLGSMGVSVERVCDDAVFGQGGVRGETFKVAFAGVFFGFDVFVFCGRRGGEVVRVGRG
jgi:hypothetical protein